MVYGDLTWNDPDDLFFCFLIFRGGAHAPWAPPEHASGGLQRGSQDLTKGWGVAIFLKLLRNKTSTFRVSTLSDSLKKA